MTLLSTAVFVSLLSLLILHEMDAIRAKEWKMFIGLKNLPDKTAYKVFSIAHLPLYFASIIILTQANVLTRTVLYYAIDSFLIIHTILHFGLRKHINNGFTSGYSNIIIYSMGVLSALHICLLIFAA